MTDHKTTPKNTRTSPMDYERVFIPNPIEPRVAAESADAPPAPEKRDSSKSGGGSA